jgi:hypothetical protein
MRRRLAFAALVCGLWLAACSSPNRGKWQGDFDGSVAGTVEFTINTRGTSLRGTMEGKTASGEDFHAKMKGTLAGDDLVAEFEGSATTDFRPVPFTGVMRGQLLNGQAHGTWECTIRFTESSMQGSWKVTQAATPP